MPGAEISHQLIYIFDTLCGWCYGATPIIARAKAVFGSEISISLMHGGLFTGENAHPMPEIRPIALEHDRRIHDLTGQPFSKEYHDNIVMNDDVVHDSTPTAIAHHAFKQLQAENLLEFLQAAQQARFVEGQDLTGWLAYVPIVKQFGISPVQFFNRFYDSSTWVAVREEFDHCRMLLDAVGAEGFPTLLLKKGENLVQVPHGHLLGRPDDIVTLLRKMMEVD